MIKKTQAQELLEERGFEITYVNTVEIAGEDSIRFERDSDNGFKDIILITEDGYTSSKERVDLSNGTVDIEELELDLDTKLVLVSLVKYFYDNLDNAINNLINGGNN